MTHNVRFRASLSNGETYTEDENIHGDATGSPWTQLLKYAQDNSLQITSLALVTQDGRTFNMPSAGNNPRFRAAETAKPDGYAVMRTIAHVQQQGGPAQVDAHFTIAEAQYPGYVLQTWVDEMNPRNSWSLVKER